MITNLVQYIVPPLSTKLTEEEKKALREAFSENKKVNVCREGHFIYCQKKSKGWSCDICKTPHGPNEQSEPYRCEKHDFDVCPECADSWKAKQSDEAIEISFRNYLLAQRFISSWIASCIYSFATRNNEAEFQLVLDRNYQNIYDVRSKPTTYFDVAAFIFSLGWIIYACVDACTALFTPVHIQNLLDRALHDTRSYNFTLGSLSNDNCLPYFEKALQSYHDDYYYHDDDNSTSTDTSTDTSEIENCIILGQGQIAMSVFLMLLAFVAYYVFYTAVRLVGWRAQNLNFILYKAKEEKNEPLLSTTKFWSISSTISILQLTFYVMLCFTFTYRRCFLYDTNFSTGCYLDGVSDTMFGLEIINQTGFALSLISFFFMCFSLCKKTAAAQAEGVMAKTIEL